MPESAPEITLAETITALFSLKAHIQHMLLFEAALARAEARAGLFSTEEAEAIAQRCHIDLFDVDALSREAAVAGTPVIPLVRMLTAQVEEPARRFVHWGATSQDAIDTALMLQMRAGLGFLLSGLEAISASCAQLAQQHRHTLMVGRTLMQQALPITFGLKAARWLALVIRQSQALRAHLQQTLALQFGGAAGTLASLGERGPQVAQFLAQELALPLPELPWHTERDRIAEIAASLGILAGAMAKIAGDILLLAQTEIGEVTEASAPGKGGSSAMPNKRNPVDAINALASARLALGVVPVMLSSMQQEHERAAGAWQAEWTALPLLFEQTANAVARVQSAMGGLQIDSARMRANLALSRGLVMAEALTMTLAEQLGKSAAHQLVEGLSQQVITSGKNLLQVAQESEKVSSLLKPDELEQALDPARYLGSTDLFINNALAAYQASLPARPNQVPDTHET